MHIDPNSRIAGLPALKIRELLRLLDERPRDLVYIQKSIESRPEDTEVVVMELRELGYVEQDPDHKGYWRFSPPGQDNSHPFS